MARSAPLAAAMADTSVEALAVQMDCYRGMPPAEKLRRVSDLTVGACMVSLAGLRQRHPHASDRELLLRLTALRLGADTVARVYGWTAPRDGA